MPHMYYLGLDPGLSEVGFGVVKKNGGELSYVEAGIIRTKAGLPLGERLTIIKKDLQEILALHSYAAVGIEELFFVKNITNGIKVAQARGILLEQVSSQGLPIYEFKPKEVKANICGDGAADKKQVQMMVQRVLNLSQLPKPHDAADALAIAVLTSTLHKV